MAPELAGWEVWRKFSRIFPDRFWHAMLVNRKKRIGIGLALVFVIIAGIFIYAHFNPEDYRFFPKCPVYMLTGYQCPGCGSQRAFYHLIHGNFATAFRYNPLMPALVPYIFSGIYLEYIANKANPGIARLREILFGKWAILLMAIVIVLFTILRNV